jgi:epoxyqueuosine reductase
MDSHRGVDYMKRDIIGLLKEEAVKHGDRLQVVSVGRLAELKRELDEFKSTEELNDFQKWIINDLYHFEIPETGFEVKSIIILALPHPFSADIEIDYQGKTYHTRSLVSSEFDEARKALKDLLKEYDYHIYEEWALPIKRLAVQSGLAIYGRNNITYVDTMGSSLCYLVFYSDIPCEEDGWRKQRVAEICESCNACIELCPTGAIRKERFLINNQRCLSAINESGGEFPQWLPENVHHTLYDCLRCQEKCPMNAAVVKNTIGPIHFSEEETELLLQGKGLEAFTEEFKTKVRNLDLFRWSEGLPRNIKAVIQTADAKEI